MFHRYLEIQSIILVVLFQLAWNALYSTFEYSFIGISFCYQCQRNKIVFTMSFPKDCCLFHLLKDGGWPGMIEQSRIILLNVQVRISALQKEQCNETLFLICPSPFPCYHILKGVFICMAIQAFLSWKQWRIKHVWTNTSILNYQNFCLLFRYLKLHWNNAYDSFCKWLIHVKSPNKYSVQISLYICGLGYWLEIVYNWVKKMY